MGFLIKSAFWLSLVLLLIPIGSGDDAQGEPGVGPIEAFMAAQAVMGDVAGFCERKPDACEVGQSALHTIGVRAKESARLAYGMLDEHFSENAAAAPVHTGSIPVIVEAGSDPVAHVPLPTWREASSTD